MIRRLVTTGIIAACLLAAPAANAVTPASLSITATPGLTPAFSQSIYDYWLNCPSGSVSLAVNAPKGTTVSVAGRTAKTGSFTSKVTLSNGQEFKWAVTSGTGSKRKTTTHYARCTPADMPIPTVTATGSTKASFYLLNPGLPGNTIGQTSYIMLVDRHGVPVWWRTAPIGPLNPTVLDSTSIATFIPTSLNPLGDFAFGRWLIWNFNGQLISRLNAPNIGMDPHELVKLPNGHFLTVSYEPIAPIDLSSFGGPSAALGYRSLIREIGLDGTVYWSWHANDHVSVGELAAWVQGLIQLNSRDIRVDGYPAFDLDHVSSVEPNGNNILLSFRHLDGIYQISKATGEILWKIGGTRIPESLDVIGDTPDVINPLGAPHDARVLPDGTVSVLDDGLGWDRNPRVVRYRIDTAARTATVVKIFNLPGIHGSNCCGSARVLSNGNWVISWGANREVTETDSNGNPLLTLLLPDNKPTYRAQPITDPKITAAYLRTAMDRSLTVK